MVAYLQAQTFLFKDYGYVIWEWKNEEITLKLPLYLKTQVVMQSASNSYKLSSLVYECKHTLTEENAAEKNCYSSGYFFTRTPLTEKND